MGSLPDGTLLGVDAAGYITRSSNPAWGQIRVHYLHIEADPVFFPSTTVSLIEDTMKDTDWLYRAITVPWLSHDPVNLVENSGFGFDSIFDETNELTPVTRSSLRLEGWEFVAVWRAEFPGWNEICWLIFRKKAGWGGAVCNLGRCP